jgi:cytidylate kinase
MVKYGMGYPFLTISRQVGAGGHMLAESLLAEMEQAPDRELFTGWTIFDAAECKKLLADANFRVTFPWIREESYRTNLGDFFYQVLAQQSPQMDAMGKLFKAIVGHARKGKYIFIGRGATCLTRSFPEGIRIRLIAPLALRIERTAEAHHSSKAAAAAFVKKHDAARKWLLRHYFNEDIDSPYLYHTVWNTAEVSIKEIAQILIHRLGRSLTFQTTDLVQDH